jgi:hypothetical protein
MLGKRKHGLVTAILLTGITAACSALFLPARTQAQDPGQSSSGDSVADAARKARENKKNAAKPTKVYTDDDVSRTPTPAPTASAAPAPAPPSEAPAGNAVDAAKGVKKPPVDEAPAKNDEKTWRERFKEQRNQIARAEKELDVLQREAEKAQVQYYPDPQKALTQQYSREDINQKDAKIAAKRDEIAQLKQGLDDLEDQLRKAGGDPGWAHE